jgi:hypothetical protein
MPNDVQEKLVAAYDRMMERLHHAIEQAESKTRPSLEKNLANAKDKAIELGELTREEADRVAAYLKRDLDDAADYLVETRAEFSDWLKFESSLLESKAGEWFAQVADQTRLEWDNLKRQARESEFYHSGEVTGPGSLSCTACGQTLNFKMTGHIPPCPKCHQTRFPRS